MASQPGPDLVLFVGRIIVEDDAGILAGWNLALDAIEEADELPVTVARHILADHSAVQHIERGE